MKLIWGLWWLTTSYEQNRAVIFTARFCYKYSRLRFGNRNAGSVAVSIWIVVGSDVGVAGACQAGDSESDARFLGVHVARGHTALTAGIGDAR